MLCFRCGSYNAEGADNCTVCGQVFGGPPPQEPSVKQEKAPPAGPFEKGDVIGGRYRVKRVIGQGAVGIVYRVVDEEIDSEVALKVISKNLLQTDDERAKFSKAIRGARKLHHPNIVRIYDEGQADGHRYFSMKLLEGLTLRKIITLRHTKGQAFTPAELVPIFHQLASALDFAHKTTWHGDLKPENVIVLPDVLQITDFNLVQGLPLKPFLGVVKSKSKGFNYIAPELRVEASRIDGRADIYSMGVILCEMLTGMAYEGHFSRAMTAALEQLPTRLDGMVRRALAEHPDGRYKKAAKMAQDLEDALGNMGGQKLPPPTTGEAKRKGPKKQPPPPPAETFHGKTDSDGGLTTEDPGLLRDEPSDSLEELGPSQVVLLDSEMKNAIADSRVEPPQIADDDDGDFEPTAHDRGRRGKKSISDRKVGLKAEDLIDTLYGEDDAEDDGLIPPPLPDDGLDASGSYDDLPAGVLAVTAQSYEDGISSPVSPTIPPPYAVDEESDDASYDKPDEDEIDETSTGGGRGRIHDELTALKREAEPDDDVDGEIVSDDSAYEDTEQSPADPKPKESSKRSKKSAPSAASIPPRLPDDSMEETLPRDVLVPARNDEPAGLAARPPIVSTPEKTERTLRPVAPPVRKEERSPARVVAMLAMFVVGAAALFWLYNTYLRPVDLPPEGPGVAVVNASGGVVELNPDGVVVMVPGGAVAEDTVLRVSRSDAAIPDGYVGYSAMYRFTPSDIELDKAVKVTIPFVGDADKAGLFWETRPGSWERLEGTITSGSVSALVRGFGQGFVGVPGAAPSADAGPAGGDGDKVAVITPEPSTPPEPTAPVAEPSAPPPEPTAPVAEPSAAPPEPEASTSSRADKRAREKRAREKREAKKDDRDNGESDAIREAREAAERRRAEREAKAAADKAAREDAAKADKAAKAKADAAKKQAEEDRKREEARKKKEKEDEAKVAMATEKKCPKGMVTIKAGSFTFGSKASDPMRNFGEKLATSASTEKYCIDYYEYPNGKKSTPTTSISWSGAKSACKRRGKRLCTEKEWERACKGPSNRRFPYGNKYSASKCNTEDAEGNARDLGAAADFKKCRSGYNGFMMAGNAEEWTADAFGSGKSSKAVKGGSADRPDFASRCSARRGVSPRTKNKTLGFRCCADPQ